MTVEGVRFPETCGPLMFADFYPPPTPSLNLIFMFVFFNLLHWNRIPSLHIPHIPTSPVSVYLCPLGEWSMGTGAIKQAGQVSILTIITIPLS